MFKAIALLTLAFATQGRVRLAAQDSEPYESWMVTGTTRPLSMEWRLQAGQYVLHVDTLGGASTPVAPKWLRVSQISLPTPKSGYHIATECAPADSVANRTIVAIAQTTNTELYKNLVQAWRLDLKTLQINELRSLTGLQCKNPGWGT